MGGDRVKFYSTSDCCSGYMLKTALEVLKNFDCNKSDYLFNDILEFTNIVKIIDIKVYPLDFTENDKSYFNKNIRAQIMKQIGVFASKIDDKSIITLSDAIEYYYAEDYWDVIDKYRVYERVSSKTFLQLLNTVKLSSHYVFLKANIVKKYDKELTDHLLVDDNAIDLLISKYLKQNGKEKIYLPIGLSVEKKEEIVKKYIISSNSNINILETIYNMPSNKEFSISDSTRVLAKEKHDKFVNDFFAKENNTGFHTDIIVSIAENQQEPVIYRFNKGMLKLSAGGIWIAENLDYPTLLNNLIYIFGFVDSEMRITYLSKLSQVGVFERVFANIQLTNYYLKNSTFNLLNTFASMEVSAYSGYLKDKHNIRIEDVLQWFYEDYLLTEFNVVDFFVNMPSDGGTYLEKCRTLCCEMESVLKQFAVLVEHAEINHNLIEISSTPTILQNIGSFIANKYFYLKEEKFGISAHLLFSDQSMLNYLEQRQDKEKYESFFDLLIHEKVNIDDYLDYQKIDIRYLIGENIIKIDDAGALHFVNLNAMYIMKDLYVNEFANSNFYIKLGCSYTLKYLSDKGWICYGSGLLSKQECAYINYYLNKSEYSNGLDLRNRYLHGTQRKKGNDKELHKTNYDTLLMLFIMITIKINDELCSRDDLQNKDQNNGKKFE